MNLREVPSTIGCSPKVGTGYDFIRKRLTLRGVVRPIEMIAWFGANGPPNPIRVNLQNEDESFTVVKIDRILFCQKEKLACNI